MESCEKLPPRLYNCPEIETLIEEIVEMHDDKNTALEYFSIPRALFTHPHDLDPVKLTGADTTLTKTPQDNGVTPPLLTQIFPPNLPQVNALEYPVLPLPHTHMYASAATHLARNSDLESIYLTDAGDALCGIYQDWAHQNPSTHLDGGIDEYSKWQVRWVKLVCLPNQCYDLPYGQDGGDLSRTSQQSFTA